MKFNKQLLKRTFAVLFLLMNSFLLTAQTSQDSSLYLQAQNNVIALYKNTIQENLHLYNGSEYVNSGNGAQGFPYFKSADEMVGSVYYDGNLYNNVFMNYDLTSDELIIMDYTKNYPVKLIKEKITYFVIDSFIFVNAAMNLSLLPDRTGFYEELYSGSTIAFAKKKKVIVTKSASEGFSDNYKQYNSYFIYKDGKIYKVNNEKAVIHVFKRKNDIKKSINSNNINFKKNFEDALIKTAKYFDKIKN